MAKKPRTSEEHKQWQAEYNQVQNAWLKWLCLKLSHFGNIDNAWQAFKAEWQGDLQYLDIDTVYNGSK